MKANHDIVWKKGVQFDSFGEIWTVKKVTRQGTDRKPYRVLCVTQSEPDAFGRTLPRWKEFLISCLGHVREVK